MTNENNSRFLLAGSNQHLWHCGCLIFLDERPTNSIMTAEIPPWLYMPADRRPLTIICMWQQKAMSVLCVYVCDNNGMTSLSSCEEIWRVAAYAVLCKLTWHIMAVNGWRAVSSWYTISGMSVIVNKMLMPLILLCAVILMLIFIASINIIMA